MDVKDQLKTFPHILIKSHNILYIAHNILCICIIKKIIMRKLIWGFMIKVPKQTQKEVHAAARLRNFTISKFIREAVKKNLLYVTVRPSPQIENPRGLFNQSFNVVFSKRTRRNIRIAAGLKGVTKGGVIRLAIDRELRKMEELIRTDPDKFFRDCKK